MAPSSTTLPRVSAAAKRLWRSTLEFSIVCMLSLQDVGHEVLLALWALRLRDARLAFPRAARLDRVRGSNNHSNGSSDSASDATGSDYEYDHDSDASQRASRTGLSSSRRHPKPRSAALAFLEKFRHGPENQSEWNLFLWRVTFPMVPLVLFTLFAVVGKMGHAPYSLLVCPIWYLCNFVLVVYPFDVVFRFPDIDSQLQRTLWNALVAISVGIAGVEWYVSSPKSRFSWVVGNTLFGVVALVGIPLFFARQNRIPRAEHGGSTTGSSGSALHNDLEQALLSRTSTAATANDANDDDQHHEPLESVLSAPPTSSLSDATTVDSRAAVSSMRQRAPVLLTTASAEPRTAANDVMVQPHSHPDESSNNSSYIAVVSSNISSSVTSDRDAHASSRAAPLLLASPDSSAGTSSHTRQTYSHATLNRPPPANRKSKLLAITAVSVAVVWLAMFTSYNASRSTTHAAGIASRYWFLTYTLSPVLCVVLFYTRQQHTHFSLDHVVVYGVLIVHIPVFLGHFCLRLFAMAEEDGGGDTSAAGADSPTSSSGSSWIKLAISVLYLLSMQGYFFVITHVVNAMAEPFTHPSLLYIGQLYYYLFWYILVGSDAPIDALYWGMLLVNNVHIAFLNTGIYTDVKRSSLTCSGSAFPLGVGVGVGSSVAVCFRATTARLRVEAAAVVTTDDDIDDDDASESDGFLSDQDAMLPVYTKSRRTAGASKRLRRSRASAAARPDSSLSSSSSSTAVASCNAAVAALRDTCSRGSSGDLRRSARKRRAAASNISLVAHRSSATAAEQLKPLYFLIKLAEQDNMADTTALILVPSLLTLMAVFDKPSEGLAIVYDQRTMWLRCICMFIGRLGGSYLAREIFAYKLRVRLRTAGSNSAAAIGTIEGMSTRLWIQRLMLQDFHRQFWYLTVVTIVVTFACFDRVDLPLRFALLT